MGLKILFYFFAVLMISSATMVVTVRNPIRAALFLVLTFVATAAIWMMMYAEFLAITLVLVYVGAVMVLFLFVIMMLDVNLARLKEGFARYLPIGLVVAFSLAAMLIWFITHRSGEDFLLRGHAEPGPDYSNTEALGNILYTDYVYPFEIAAVILLVAIIAAIALTLRKRGTATKYQNPVEQVAVKSADRVRVVDMPSEDKK